MGKLTRMTITAIIVARNEAGRLGDCLSKLTWVDELIVVDNNSTDATSQVAREYQAKVFKAASPDFATLRNFGKIRAKSDWLLYIDADEIVSKDLAQEIKTVLMGASDRVAYSLRRKNYYLGHFFPRVESIVRLIRKDNLKFWQGRIHETAIVDGPIGILNQPLIHYSHRNLTEMVIKTNEWSLIEAQLREEAGHPPVTWWRLLRVMGTGFCSSFIKLGGWRAGNAGLIEGIYQGFSMFITYAKLWELQKKSSQG